MSRLPLRAAGFALLALILIGLVSAAVLLAVVGLPDPKVGADAFTAEAARIAKPVDYAVGGVVMLALGWLVARPFAGRDALIAAGLMSILYIVLDMGVVAAMGRTGGLEIGAVLLTYAVKVGAALLGGLLASRRSAPA